MSYNLVQTRGSTVIQRSTDNACIPLDTDNRDCQQFIVDWANGVDVFDHLGAPLPYSPENLTALGLA